MGRIEPIRQAPRHLEKSQAWPKAERLYRQLLQLTPNYGPAQLQLANALNQQKRPIEAIGCLDALLGAADHSFSTSLHARAYTNRGALRHLQGDLDAAGQTKTKRYD